MARFDLTDAEWSIIAPLLPGAEGRKNGRPRPDDRKVLNGIFFVLRTGTPWRDLPERYGPRTTCYNRFVRWRKAGVWDRMMNAITAAYDGDIQMIDSTSIRAHQQAATAKRMARPVGKRFASDDLSSLRKRIRPFSMEPLAKMEIGASWSS